MYERGHFVGKEPLSYARPPVFLEQTDKVREKTRRGKDQAATRTPANLMLAHGSRDLIQRYEREHFEVPFDVLVRSTE